MSAEITDPSNLVHDNYINELANIKSRDSNFAEVFSSSMLYLMKKKGYKRIKEIYPTLAPSDSKNTTEESVIVLNTQCIQETYYRYMDKLSKYITYYGDEDSINYDKVKYTLYSTYYTSAASLVEKKRNFSSAVNDILKPIIEAEERNGNVIN